MIKRSSIMTSLAIAALLAISFILASSADRINPPAESVVAPTHVDMTSEVIPDPDPAIARGAIRRILTVHVVSSRGRAQTPLPAPEPGPASPKAPASRRIAIIGKVTGEDGATTYWFRDLDGAAIYPLVPNGDSVDGWRLLSIVRGTAVLSIDGETFQVKEK